MTSNSNDIIEHFSSILVRLWRSKFKDGRCMSVYNLKIFPVVCLCSRVQVGVMANIPYISLWHQSNLTRCGSDFGKL